MGEIKRSKEFAWLTLAGMPGFAWCTFTHFCMCGHLAHDDPPGWRVYADGAWAAAFLAAAVAGMQSEVPIIAIDVCLLLLVVFSRLVLANFGFDTILGLPIFDVAAAVYLALHALGTLIRVHGEEP
jgi:hypothetical protein